MLRSYFAAAFRNLSRSKLYAGISIFGLALGLCAALLAALIVRNQMTYDRFVLGYDRTYLITSILVPNGRPRDVQALANAHVAMFLKLRVREIEVAARITSYKVELGHGDIRAKEQIYWADADLFKALPLPVYAGNLGSALARPDGLVLTRSSARKYFGRDDPIGETLEVDGANIMTVTAVIEDLPMHSTTLESGIFLSALASFSKLPPQIADFKPNPSGAFSLGGRLYVRLAPHASIESVRRILPQFFDIMVLRGPPGLKFFMEPVRIDRVNLIPEINPGIQARLRITGIIGALILLIACINFVNLTTARASRRAIEMTIRKVSGASRGQLIAQALGEAALYVGSAMLLAMMLTELLLPPMNAFLETGATFKYWREPRLMVGIIAGAASLTVLAGLYPAFILSAFRPIDVLKGTAQHSASHHFTRQALVILQFTILITLIVAAAIAFQQRIYATSNALRVKTDQHLIIELHDARCSATLQRQIAALPGVLGSACTSDMLLSEASFGNYRLKDGTFLAITIVNIGPGLLELFDLKPLAGRFLDDARDGSARQDDRQGTGRVVINETAMRRLGFATPAAALGPAGFRAGGDLDIVGVVRDFTLRSIEQPIGAVAYSYAPGRMNTIDVKLSGRSIPEALAGIDRITQQWVSREPIKRFFLDDHIQSLYLAMLREAKTFAILSGVAVFLACLGLIGLSAAATERRTKEIGIRKVMGAETSDVVRLMVWQFTQPVLWAGVIAVPLSAYLMKRWLEGFAYHTSLTPWPFLGAALGALAIAVLTVSTHCYIVARAKPVASLRYE